MTGSGVNLSHNAGYEFSNRIACLERLICGIATPSVPFVLGLRPRD